MAEGNPIKYSDLVIDDGAIQRLLNAIDTLEKRFLQSQKNFRKEIEKTKKSTEDFTGATEDQESELEKLEKQLEKLIKANKELQETDGQLAEQKKQAVKIAKDEAKLRKKLIELTDDQAVANEELKLEIQQQRKVVKEQAKANKGLTGEYDKQSKQLNELRKQYKNLAVSGKENTDEAKKLLIQVSALDEKLKAVDKSVGQTQRSVGNYKEQVKEALEETGAFSESMAGAVDQSGLLGDIISKLQIIIGFLSKAYGKNTGEVVENTVAQEVNTKATKKATIVQRFLARAVNFTSKSFGVLKKALVRSGIGLIIVALGSLVAVFKEASVGVDALGGGIAGIGQVLKVLAGRYALFGKAIVDVYQAVFFAIKGVFSALTLDFDEALVNFEKSLDQGGQAVDSFSGIFDGLGKAISDAFESGKEYNKLIRSLEKDLIGMNVEIAKLNAESERQEEIEADATKTFAERTKAVFKSIDAQKKASELGLEIAKRELEAEQTLLTALEKGNESTLNQAKIVSEKQIQLIEAQKDADIKASALRRTANQLNQDLIEKNLDILIDGFDNQKTVNEKLIENEKNRFDERRKLLVETIDLQKKILSEEVNEIQKVAKQKIDIADLIATKDSKQLNEKIRAVGLSEILEGRLLEVIRESRTQEFELNQSLIDLDLERLELKKEISQQLEDLTIENIKNEKTRSIELQAIQEKRAINEIKEKQKVFGVTEEEYKILENQITEIKKKGVEDRATIELEALTKDNQRAQKQLELDLLNDKKNQEEINEELTKLKIEQLKKEIELEEQSGRDSIDKQLELARLTNDLILDEEQKKADAIRQIQDVTADAIFTSFQKTLDKQISELDRLEDKQNAIVDRQTQRAIEGLENNLAFEEDALADLEQKKIKAQKKQIALEKISALYNAYSSASASGDSNAIITVLRDFSILQGLESAISSFGSGTGEHGSIEDSLNANQNGSKNGNSIQNGVVRGESHKKRGFGVPVLVEGNEGIWKGSTMDKFGKNNFIALTKAIDSGAIGSNFMQPQVNAMQVVQTGGSDPRLLNEMVATRKAIENKPEQVVDVEKFSRNVIDFIDERKTGNKKIINRHRVTRKRF
jgi:DNA repair exonuclease SbcCD ATPase subunit